MGIDNCVMNSMMDKSVMADKKHFTVMDNAMDRV